MALVLRTNGAPLSGALFVSNPRKNRRNRRNGIVLKANSRKRKNGHAAARRAAALKSLRNRRKNSKAKSRRNKLMLNYKGNGIAVSRNRRKPVRRNSYGSFQNKATAPIVQAVKKVPVVGTVASQYVAPLVMGAAVGAVHYGALKMLGMVPMVSDYVEKVRPVQFTLTGVAAATALRFIPIGSKEIRDQLAVGALLSGAALDVYRFLTAKVGDLGELDEDFDGLYELDEDFDGLYEDGYIEAGGLYEDGYIETGDGGAYDVLPLAQGTADSGYSGAAMVDAYASPNDLSMDEGEAALAGPGQWYARFGPPPGAPYRTGGYSSMVGQPGHRFGWLIRLVGFDRFRKIAALPPARRLALIANLKQQAASSVDSTNMAGIALTETGGLALEMGNLGGLAIDMQGSTLDMAGELSGIAIEMNGLGASMAAGSAI